MSPFVSLYLSQSVANVICYDTIDFYNEFGGVKERKGTIYSHSSYMFGDFKPEDNIFGVNFEDAVRSFDPWELTQGDNPVSLSVITPGPTANKPTTTSMSTADAKSSSALRIGNKIGRYGFNFINIHNAIGDLIHVGDAHLDVFLPGIGKACLDKV